MRSLPPTFLPQDPGILVFSTQSGSAWPSHQYTTTTYDTTYQTCWPRKAKGKRPNETPNSNCSLSYTSTTPGAFPFRIDTYHVALWCHPWRPFHSTPLPRFVALPCSLRLVAAPALPSCAFSLPGA